MKKINITINVLPNKILIATTFLMIITILGLIIVFPLFTGEKSSNNITNLDNGIYTAISILVALFAALFIWTALKESDFKNYKDKIDGFSKGLNELKDLASLNYLLFHVSSKGIDSKDDFKDFRKKVFNVEKSGMISQREILRISRILWQRNKLDEAFLIRKEAYKKKKDYYTCLNYCSISNYMQKSTLKNDICDISNITPFLKLLTRHENIGYNDFGCDENRKWIIAGIRFISAASHSEENHLNALFCFLKAIKLVPLEKYYYRNFILGALCLKEFKINKINYDIIRKLDDINSPTRNISNSDLKEYILQNLLEFNKITIEDFNKRNSSFQDLVFEYFMNWKKTVNIKESSSNYLIYKSFFILIEDICSELNDTKSEALYDFFNFEIIAQRASMSEVDKSSFFNIYSLLENKFIDDQVLWKRIEMLYLTFYNFMAVDDYKANDEIKNGKGEKIYKLILPLWCDNKC